jgi:hypothetical protein
MRKFAAFKLRCPRVAKMVHEAGSIWHWPFAGAFDHMLRIRSNATLATLQQRLRLLNRQAAPKTAPATLPAEMRHRQSDTIFSDT